MKWILWVILAWLGVDGIILCLMRRHIRQMEQMGYRYNYELERWEKDESDKM